MAEVLVSSHLAREKPTRASVARKASDASGHPVAFEPEGSPQDDGMLAWNTDVHFVYIDIAGTGLLVGEAERQGKIVVSTELEHHSNYVPWQYIASRTGASFKLVPLGEDNERDLSKLDEIAAEGNVKVLAIGLDSTALGTVNPIDKLVTWAHGLGAIVVAGQSALNAIPCYLVEREGGRIRVGARKADTPPTVPAAAPRPISRSIIWRPASI